MFDYKYAYLFGNLVILFPLWLFFFLHRRDLKKKILLMSTALGVVGPVSEIWYIRDYWHPQTFTTWPIGLEDFLFGFFIGGIASVIYQELFNKRWSKSKIKSYPEFTFIMTLFALLVLRVFTRNLSINSIYASLVIFVGVSGMILFFRRDLVIDAFLTALLVLSIAFLGYLVFLYIYPEVVQKWWVLENISGILIFGIPIEELMWAFGLGLFVGPCYEFFAGLRLLKK